MKNKILWLSILGLALARPPNSIDETTSNIGTQQSQRGARSIWPFVSSATTTEAPISYPPALANNNEWFVQGETPLPEGIDLTKYPVWKIHKYNGIDLRPVNLQPQNVYPPEIHHTYEQGYSSGSSLGSDYSHGTYQNEYPDYLPPGGQSIQHPQSSHGPYPATGYPPEYSSPPATHPANTGTYQTGEFQSSSFTPGTNQFGIQSQQKHEVYVPPQPLQDYRAPAERPLVQELPQISTGFYAPNNGYQAGNLNYRGHSQMQESQLYGDGEVESQSSDAGNPDISFLDDLGGLAPYLPDPKDNVEKNEEREVESTQQGFLANIFSRFRGTTEAPVAADVTINADEGAANSGGFLSSIFGLRPDPQSQNVAAVPDFYQPEISQPAPVSPTTYYLPKTRGSYIAVKVPPNVNPSFTSSPGAYSDISNINFHQVPSVPFTEREIPHIPGPTLDSSYPYNLDYSEVRNSGSNAPAVNSDYYSSIVNEYQGPPPSTRSPSQFLSKQGNHQQSNLRTENISPNNGAESNGPRAEYFHSSNSGLPSNVPTPSSQTTSGTKYYQGQQNLQESQYYPGMHQTQSPAVTVTQLQDELPTTFANNAHDSDNYQNGKDQEFQYQNFDTTNLNSQDTPTAQNTFDPNQASVSFVQNGNENGQESQYQNIDTTNSNFQDTFSGQNTFDHNQGSVGFAQNGRDDEPIPAAQVSGGFLPSLGYDLPTDAGNQINYNGNKQENNQQITNANLNVPYNQPRGNIGDDFTQNFDASSGVLNHDPQPPKETAPVQSQPSGPVYQSPIPATQSPSDVQLPYESYRIVPVKDANDFHEMYSEQNEEDSRFIQNLNALTSYGTPTSSYQLNSRVPASSNIRSITIPAPTKDEVTNGLDNHMNKDGSRSTLPEQSPTRKSGRIVRKVMKRRTLVDNNHSRRSAPERQAPTEESGTPLIVRSEIDSLPDVRGSRQFHEAEVIDGYSKVQNKEHREHQVVDDSAKATMAVNTSLKVAQE